MKWQGVVADMGATIVSKDITIASKDTENERLRAEIAELRAKFKG